VTQPWTARVWSMLAAGVATVLVLRRAPRTPAGFAAGASLVFLAFFAFNKQAFCNYYFFVIGGICCALAASQPPAGEPVATGSTGNPRGVTFGRNSTHSSTSAAVSPPTISGMSR